MAKTPKIRSKAINGLGKPTPLNRERWAKRKPDSGALYRQAAAKVNFTWFSDQQVRLPTSSFVLVETIALLQCRVGLESVRDFNTKIMPLVEIVWGDADWQNKGIERLLSENRKDVSLVDCMNLGIMEGREIDVALTFDRHSKEYGFKIAATHAFGRTEP